MLASRKKRLKRTAAVEALAAAAVAAAFVCTLQLNAQEISGPQRAGRIAAPAAAPASEPAADTENTGKLDEPATARDPGDLMNSGALVYVDDSFASVDKLRTAIRSAGQGQSQLAIKQFQEITDHFGQKLVLLNDNSYVSITDYVRERLLAMPAVKNGMYDQLFGNDAKREIDAAIENRDVAGLIRSSDRYYPSSAALKGLNQAAEWYFERGEFTAAAQTWRKALAHPLAGEQKAKILFSAGVAESLGQSPISARALRDRLEKEYPDATGTVSGTDVKLLSKLNDILGLPAWEKTELAADEWPAFEGGASRSRLLSTAATIGARLWGLSLANGPGAASSALNSASAREIAILRAQGLQINAPGTTDMGLLNSHPVISNGILFVHSGTQVIAMSVNAGAKLWAYPQEVANTDAQTIQYMQNYGVSPRFSAHDSATVFGEQVFAVLPVTSPSQGSAIGIRSYNGMPIAPMRLVCLNRDDGTQVWSRMASEIKVEKEGSITFSGSPLVTRQGVFVMARKLDNANFTQQYLVRLDRETGEPTWSCYLCSTNNQYNMNGLAAIPVPSLVDDVLYISTGQGADCAVDANAGRILWLRPTTSASASANTGNVGFPQARIQMQMQQSLMLASWKYNPPVVIGDNVLTTDNGLVLRIYNRWNGSLLKSIPASDLASGTNGTPAIDVLAGALGTKVVMSISNVSVCFDLASLLGKNPKPFWTSTVAAAGSPQGRPFLSATGYYVPFTSKLVRIDTQSGKSEQWDWPKNDKDENGKPGNLLVTSEQVIVVNDMEVAGYSKWETARDNRMAKIAANPKDPEPYLALAEIGFRTNHTDIAQSYMKQSVDIANTGAAPAGQSNLDFLGRLYRTNLGFAEQLFGKEDSALWGQTRFYYEQSRASARLPEQQAEWRMRLAELSKAEKKPEEAAMLYTEVLTDPALRVAGYHEGELNQSAGSTAEQKIRDIIKARGVEVFKRFEDQAGALAKRGIAAKDPAVLQQVIDGYPNSTAALSAGTTLAALYQDKQDWENARRVLFWLQPRLQGSAQARTIADLVAVNIALKKYRTAIGLAARGTRLYKDYNWTDAGKKLTFADLKVQIARLGGVEMEGTLPILHASPGAPDMQSPPEGPLARKEKELISFLDPIALNQQLLVPVETEPGLRPSNLLFVRNGDKLAITDTAKGTVLAPGIPLGQNADTVLLGATRESAVLLQRDRIIGVDLKTFTTWTVPLKNIVTPPAPGRSGVALSGGRQVMVPQGANVQVVGGNLIINGNMYGPAEVFNLVDQNGNPYSFSNSGSDPEMVRRAAFSVLGAQVRFTTARLLNGYAYVLAGNDLTAYDLKTGKPVWANPATLPNGVATCFVGNEDLVVAQCDDAAGRQSTFYAIDAQSGRLRKTLKLETDAGPERAVWRGLGDDGMLYVSTDQSTAAYDMIADLSHAIWRRTDVGARFSGATALTLDGLIAVSDEHEVECLALESGETRWHAQMKLELLANSAISGLRSTIEGDLIVYQSQDGSAAYVTYPSQDPDRQLSWLAAKVQEPLARHSLEVSDTLAVELLQGSLPNKASMGTNVILRDRKGGRIYTDQPVVISRGWAVRTWQVVDGGIVFELLPGNGNPAGGNNVTGQIYIWKANVPATSATAPATDPPR